MEQWDALVLKTHNELGYASEYEDLIEKIIKNNNSRQTRNRNHVDADKELKAAYTTTTVCKFEANVIILYRTLSLRRKIQHISHSHCE